MADSGRRDVEHEEWMNEQVKVEIEDVRRRFGFKEREAVAFWHLRRAGKLMSDMMYADEFWD